MFVKKQKKNSSVFLRAENKLLRYDKKCKFTNEVFCDLSGVIQVNFISQTSLGERRLESLAIKSTVQAELPISY